MLKQVKAMTETLNHLRKKIKRRELLILATVLISFGSVPLFEVLDPDPEYYSNYGIGFIRGFIVFLICFNAYKATESKRIVGVMIFASISMLFNIAYVYDVDYYYLLDEVRSTGKYNFSDSFKAYELTCLVISVINTIKGIASKDDAGFDVSNNGVYDSNIGRMYNSRYR